MALRPIPICPISTVRRFLAASGDGERRFPCRPPRRSMLVVAAACGLSLAFAGLPVAFGQAARTAAQRSSLQSIEQRIGSLRDVPDARRGAVTKQLALEIRRLSAPNEQIVLAASLANLATEGDFGRDTLQEVATTLSQALGAMSGKIGAAQLMPAYMSLAQLVLYENARVPGSRPLEAALKELKADDKAREEANFTLTDLNGKQWTLKSLKGKVALVNFWATWCPPCRKEIPDLDALYRRFKSKGLVILGISNEKAEVVRPFVAKSKIGYPILVDADGQVNRLFRIQGIPRSVIYDRKGKLAAEAIDMRTQRQLLALLAQAGMR